MYFNVASCVYHGRWFPIDGGCCVDCKAEDTKLAAKIANRAAGRPDADELTCTDWQDEPTQPGVAKRTPAEILSEAINRAEAMLPHGLEATIEWQLCTRTFDVTARCPHCSRAEVCLSVSEGWIERFAGREQPAEHVRDCVRTAMRPCIEATCCDPLDRYVDGMRVRECLERYTQDQRGDKHPGPFTDSQGRRWDIVWHCETRAPLTPLQRAAAQQAWSAQLRAKQQEARERERNEVAVDDDRWEP